jgi:hypothetical protein
LERELIAMFKSKRRPIVIPQSEHLKLVGALALLWGNSGFDLPPIDRLSMVAGMGFHDRGYGFLDNSPIGGMTDAEWEVIARRGFFTQYNDVNADMIVKYHFRRLASGGDSDLRRSMADEFSQEIAAQLARHQLSKELFDRIDHITNLCDMISFNFCFELPADGEVSIFSRNNSEKEVAVRFHVENGIINVFPWPFSAIDYEGYIIGYGLDGYPSRLDPVILPFHLIK